MNASFLTDAAPHLDRLHAAAEIVHGAMKPTPAIHWPLLSERVGAEVWVKQENHTPLGAFKVRGGLTYMTALRTAEPGISGVIAATRGNHGQSIAFAARRVGITATIVVPRGNSVEKNAAMRALGADLIEHGADFNEALDHAHALKDARGLHMVPSFHPWLIDGVASYALELFAEAPKLDVLFVPVGMGSGICACLDARDALGLATPIVGVVSDRAASYALSFEAGRPVATNSADTMADGLAVRIPHPDAVARINAGADRVVTVSDEDIRAAMRYHFTDTHNIAEGAGAAPLAGLLNEHGRWAGKRIGLVCTGGNVDAAVYRQVLAEDRG